MKYHLEISHSREICWRRVDSFSDEQSARDAILSPTFECTEFMVCRISWNCMPIYTVARCEEAWVDIGPSKYSWNYSDESVSWSNERSLLEAWEQCRSPSWMIFGMDHVPNYHSFKIALEFIMLAAKYEVDDRCKNTLKKLEYDARGMPVKFSGCFEYETWDTNASYVHYYATHPLLATKPRNVILNASDNVCLMLQHHGMNYDQATKIICDIIRKCITVYDLLSGR